MGEKEKAILGSKGKDADNIAMTATTEFCNVVQTPLEKMDTLKHESFRGSSLYKQQAAQRKGLKMSSKKAGGMAIDEDLSKVEDRDDDDVGLHEEGLDLS